MTNPTPHGQVPASSAVLKAIREANMQLVRTGDDAFMLVPYKVATAQAAPAVTAQGQYYDAHFASSGHRPYFLPFSARTAIAARHGTHVTKEFNALVADVVSEFMARHLATPAAPAPVAEDVEDAARYQWIRGPVEESTRYSRWRIEYWDGPNGWQPMQRERMDAAIDAARAQAAQPEGGA